MPDQFCIPITIVPLLWYGMYPKSKESELNAYVFIMQSTNGIYYLDIFNEYVKKVASVSNAGKGIHV